MATTGAKSSIGTSAVALVGSATSVTYGVSVKAAAANTLKVYVGLANTVTATSADATDGYELAAGQEVFIPRSAASDAASIYLISTNTGQKVFYIAN